MSGPITKGNGQIVSTKKPGDNLAGMLIGMKGEIARALPKHLNPDRMARIVTTALRITPKLALSEPVSFIGCVLTLAQLGLEPNTPLGHAYLIPRNNKKRGCVETTIIIGYKGFVDLARRSGIVTGIYAQAVFEGDLFDYTLGLHPDVQHKPLAPGRVDPKKVHHAYGVARIRNEDPLFEVLTVEQIDARRRRSMASSDGPWVTDTIAMMRKTAIRALWPMMPQSAEMVSAVNVDEAGEKGQHIGSVVTDGVAGEILDQLGAPRDDDGETHDPDTGELLASKRQHDPSTGEASEEDLPPVG